jgi:medium-chain acyl-[acyl-carrier-protein] hydrolase
MIIQNGADRWVIRPRPISAPRVRLICFPFSGGGASLYARWPADLPADIDVCAVQLPGREQRIAETPYVSLALLIQDLMQALRPYLDAPVALFGHSLGGLIAFELTRMLRRTGGQLPVCVFLAGSHPPHLPRRQPNIHSLPDAEFIAGLREYGGTPEEALQNAALMELLLPTLRADFSLTETHTYVSETPLDVPLSAFCGLDDPIVEPNEIAGWRDLTQNTFTLRMVPGHHFFVQSARGLVLSAIVEDLEASTLA